jgi:hypothetical protein
MDGNDYFVAMADVKQIVLDTLHALSKMHTFLC